MCRQTTKLVLFTVALALTLGTPSRAFDVYHSFDEPVEGIEAQLIKIESTYPHIAELQEIGRSVQDRPVYAMRLTNEATSGDKPAVLFVATIHGREWIATQMAMRWIEHLTANFGLSSRVTSLLDSTAVWVIPVANPDGYEYTFTTERYWYKNLYDNDGNGMISIADGVDINSNFDYRWGRDDEGSSPFPFDVAYRGPAANSEPETQAIAGFVQAHDFRFVVDYHAYGNAILCPWHWQVGTPAFDEPIFEALAGTDSSPAVWDTLVDQGYDTGVGIELYTRNGGFTDWAYGDLGIPAFQVLLTSGYDEFGTLYDFKFPDDAAKVQTVFEDNLEFAFSVAESAVDPAHPVSPVGLAVADAYHTPVTNSHGRNQIIEVIARKGLALALHYSIGTDPEQTASFAQKRGAYYNKQAGAYFSRYVAVIPDQLAGESVSYRIGWDGSELGPYAYTVTSATGNPVLLVAAEDYTGEYPIYPPGGPLYLSYYTDALDAGGYAYDVWDIDAHGEVPSYAEVLSHYDVVVWYTGDDYAPTTPGFAAHAEQCLNLREYVNYSCGKLFATGQDISWLSASHGMFPDDFFQYYLGAYEHFEGEGMDAASSLPFDVVGETGDPVFGGLSFAVHGGTGADNQAHADTFLPTSRFLAGFDDDMAARYVRPGNPFGPHSGDYHVHSQIAGPAYKRLGGTFTLPAGAPALRFWISYDLEHEWDFAFVEVRVAGSEAWTTLPDENGLTTTDPGQSCISGWQDQLHPFLAHYMDDDCNPRGTSGEWNALTGRSGGWKQVEFDLSAYAGNEVELYIGYASDWSTEFFGVFVDDIELSGHALEDFESGMGVWEVGVAPGSEARNNWARIDPSGFDEGPAIRTPYSVYLGLGLEAIDTEAHRSAVISRVLDYLESTGCDSDGDGLTDDVDSCPDEDATGFDADGDGCLDTMAGLTEMLDTLVAMGVIEEQMRNSLASKIDGAASSSTRANLCAAVHQLEALKNQIEAQRGKKISDEAANLLIGYADSLIALLLDQLPPFESC